MEKLAVTMSHESSTGSLPSSSLCTSEFLEAVWELSHNKGGKMLVSILRKYLLKAN